MPSNAEYNRNWKLQKRYGITSADYDRMLDRQNGRCALCEADACQTRQHLSVDHCHATGRVRALLCYRCNVAVGQLGDSPEALREAADRLESLHAG